MSPTVIDQFAESVAAMEAEFPGYFLESLHTGMGWGSHDPDGNYKPNVGAWRSRFGIVSWIATVIQEGWEQESEHHIGSGDTPTAAIEVVTQELRRRRDRLGAEHNYLRRLPWRENVVVERLDRPGNRADGIR